MFRRLVEMHAVGDLAGRHEVIAPNYVGNVSAGERDLEEFRQSILRFHEVFVHSPDLFQINDQLADREKAATRMTVHVRFREKGRARYADRH